MLLRRTVSADAELASKLRKMEYRRGGSVTTRPRRGCAYFGARDPRHGARRDGGVCEARARARQWRSGQRRRARRGHVRPSSDFPGSWLAVTGSEHVRHAHAAVDWRRWDHAKSLGYKSFSDADLDQVAVPCNMMIGARPDWLPAVFTAHAAAECLLWPIDPP